MIRLWQFLRDGCWHVWKPTSQSRYDDDYGQSGPVVFVVCVKCGHRRFFRDATIGDWEDAAE